MCGKYGRSTGRGVSNLGIGRYREYLVWCEEGEGKGEGETDRQDDRVYDT